MLAPVPLVMSTRRTEFGRAVDERQAIGGGRISSGPAFEDLDLADLQDGAKLFEDQRVDPLRRERVRRCRIMVRIANDQRAVGTPHRDQMHAVRQVLGLLDFEHAAQSFRLGELRVAEIADEPEVRHHGRADIWSDWCKPEHVKLAAGEPVLAKTFGKKADEIIAGADDRRVRGDRSA